MPSTRSTFTELEHVLYVTGEWLFLQQDDERARTLLETALQVDPNFPAALNRLGYLYLDSSNPDPVKAIASLKRYAEVEPTSPNPQDSLGEVLREAGNDQDSIEHYHAALQSILRTSTRSMELVLCAR